MLLAPLASAARADGPLRVTTLAAELPGAVGGVTVDALGFIYVADFGETVWKISPAGEVEVFADTLYGASGNTVDAAGNLLQSNFRGNSITRIARDGSASTLASDIPGPVGLVIGEDGSIYACSCPSNRILRISESGEVTTFAEGDLFNCPNGITVDDKGDLYVVNFSDGRAVHIDAEGEASLLATLPGGGNGHIVWVGPDLYATSLRGNSVFRLTREGDVTRVAGTGAFGQKDSEDGATAIFSTPNGIAYDRTRDILYTNDYLNPWLERFSGRLVPRSSLRALAFPTLQEEFSAVFAAKGAAAAERATRERISRRPGQPYEIILNVFGYSTLQSGRVAEAQAIFETNASLFPESFNVWDSLAEVHKNLGHRDTAIEFYRKSLALNPGNSNAAAMLEELGASD